MKSTIKSLVAFAALALITFCVLPFSGTAQSEQSREGLEFFEKKIRPVLVTNCYPCHSAQSSKPQGGLMLDSREGMLKGGALGVPAIVPGDPEKSRLVQAIRYADARLQMPPMGKLSAQQIADFETWIKMGAPDPRTQSAAAPPPYDFAEAAKFWSFKGVVDQTPPQVRDTRWVRSPIDRFVLAKLEEKGLKPAADADKRTLIRRVTFDLIGLPPTPDEIDAFLRDSSEKAFERVVDRLLASPHYGERWGRHWLDIVRYADTSGCNSDFPIPSAYKYRNYVIKSFNEDKAYDRFVREQVAGDLLPAKTDAQKYEQTIATGYLAMSRRFGSRNNEFHLTIDDTIDNLGKAVLGLSVSCARCHDHKFDPIPTADYYAMYGIFSSTKYAFPGTEIYRHTKDFIPLAQAEQGARLVKWQTELAELDDKVENLTVERAGLERRAKAAKEAEKAGKQPAAKKNEGAAVDDKAKPARTVEMVDAEMKQTKARIVELENSAPHVEKAYAVSEGKPANAKIFRKGDPRSRGDEVPRGFLKVLGGQRLPDGAATSGRLELAGWLTDPKNPLTARVIVNRLWQYHFGKGIVQTPNDFGARGNPPTHPELLDYLASRFVQGGWSVKSMHRMILLSRAYRMSSADDPRNSAIDANNDLLWKFNRRRLSVEEIRDSLLMIGGSLDTSMAGVHPFPPEKDWRYTQHVQFFADYDSEHRSVYLMQQRLKKRRFFEVFDGADTNATTPERPVSTTPIQALFMMNDPFAHKQADSLAVRVGMAVPETDKRIDYAYRLVFGRPATREEIRQGADYLRAVSGELAKTQIATDQQPRAALASYMRVLLSTNEFLFVD